MASLHAALDPGCTAFLRGLAAQGGLGAPELGLLRAALVTMAAAAGAGPDLPGVEDGAITLPGRTLPCRRYRPLAHGCSGLVVFFHGGGWVAGDLDTHDELCRRLAHVSGLDVLSVAYRLAPEHPWPAAPHDAVDTLRWVSANRAALGFPAGKLAVAGDSAGGTLAAVCALECGDAIRVAALVYPLVEVNEFDDASMRSFGEDYFLTREMTAWFLAQYLPPGTDTNHPWVSPRHALAQADTLNVILLSAGFDPLRDQQWALAGERRAAGGRIEHLHIEGAIHGFLSLRGVIGPALPDQGIAFLAAELCRQLR